MLTAFLAALLASEAYPAPPGGRAVAGASGMNAFEIRASYKGPDGIVPIGSLKLRLTCTGAIPFSQELTTPSRGKLIVHARGEKCRVDSVEPVQIRGKYYAWSTDVRLSADDTPVLKLTNKNAHVSEKLDTSVIHQDDVSVGLSDVVLPGATDERPQPLVVVEPEVPQAAIDARRVGTVWVQLLVSTDGRVVHTDLLSTTNPIFNDAAVAAVTQWRYLPGHHEGRAREALVPVRVDFRLNP